MLQDLASSHALFTFSLQYQNWGYRDHFGLLRLSKLLLIRAIYAIKRYLLRLLKPAQGHSWSKGRYANTSQRQAVTFTFDNTNKSLILIHIAFAVL